MREHLSKQIDACGLLLGTVLHNVTSGIAVFDGKELRLRWANRQYQQVLIERWGDVDMTGCSLAEIIPGAEGSGLAEVFRQVAITGVPHFEPEYAHKGLARGITYWQWSLLPLANRAGDIPDVMLFLTDVTEQVLARKKTEQLSAEAEKRAAELQKAYGELETRTRELSTLLDIARQVGSTLELQPLLDLILAQLKTVIDYTGAAIFIVEDTGLTLLAYRGPVPQQQLTGLHLSDDNASLSKEIVSSHEPTIFDDLTRQATSPAKTLAHPGMLTTIGSSRALVQVPIMTQERLIGILQIDHVQPGFFTDRHAQLALAIANQAAVALENSLLYREARKVAVLEERARLARELHDSVSQALYAISLAVHAAGEMLGRHPDRLPEMLADMSSLVHGALADMRSLIFELHPESVEKEGLAVVFAKLAEAARARYNIDLFIDLCPEDGLSLDTKEALYRICREALWNTLKHAQAKVVVIRLFHDQGHVVMELSDDGAGFDTRESFPGHFGLNSMRDRAASLGGTLEIESVPGQGTNVRARIPVDAVLPPSPAIAEDLFPVS